MFNLILTLIARLACAFGAVVGMVVLFAGIILGALLKVFSVAIGHGWNLTHRAKE